MSRSLAFSIGLGASVAFPASAPPGSILLGESGPIVNHVALVGADGVPVEVVPAAGGFVPSNDNLTDLGDATHRFRSLWLGTSIRNTSSLDVLLDAGTTATLGVRNPTTAQGILLEVDGDVRPLVNGVSSLGSGPSSWAALYLHNALGTPSTIEAEGSLDVAVRDAATTQLRVRNTVGGQVCNVLFDGTLIPEASNTRDLGSSTAATWRTLYLGTSIVNDGDLTIDLRGGGGGARTLILTNTSGGLNRADLSVQGYIQTYGPGIWLAATPSAFVGANGINASLHLYANGNGTVALRDPGNSLTVVGATGHGLVLSSAVDTGVGPTINRPSGVVRVPSGSSSVTVTNDLAAVGSLVFATIQNATTNPVSVLSAVAGAGSFVVTLSGDPGASNADVAFLLFNAAP